MPSPFPGMDPFIGGQEWEDFHHEMISAVRQSLMPQVLPRYVVRVRKPEEQEEAFLTIRWRETMEVVSVIELLSPTNKRAGSDGQREYRSKREQILRSATHLVELDLLRGGERLRTIEALPPDDYYAFVSRGEDRPRVAVYHWSLRDPLIEIPIPLRGDDPDATLDLQAAFATVYDRARYDLSLDYGAPLRPPLSEADAAWLRERLAAAGAAAGGVREGPTAREGDAEAG